MPSSFFVVLVLLLPTNVHHRRARAKVKAKDIIT